ncbi:hypothetical protein [Candidatus Methanocrinis natronophilus]|uniref:Uncharacterized protein n=1 Tax=Candidatus Methanocrinis natronophilus TaxID=3033396 RepID=A0ABT5X7H7_9EURY|nr:hypothetical protein [Candidatus Methanocrinis natronophilus]MDF0590608.1 hypothetical protein [Candidatus Methanocrinis natronophilus]
MLLAFSLAFNPLFLATALGEEDYLGVLGPRGVVAKANYSEYGSAFEEFMTGPTERNLSSYPDYLVEFLEGRDEPPIANYSQYTPAFEEFMNLSKRSKLYPSSYPDYLIRFLNDTQEPLRINYTRYSPAFEEFMNATREGRENLTSYPDYLRWFLNR